MHDLKELFERSLENIRPATPPPGQWNTIQGQLSGPQAIGQTTTSTTTGFYAGMGGGVLLGSLLTTILIFLVFPQYITKYHTTEVLLAETSAMHPVEPIEAAKAAQEVAASTSLPAANLSNNTSIHVAKASKRSSTFFAPLPFPDFTNLPDINLREPVTFIGAFRQNTVPETPASAARALAVGPLARDFVLLPDQSFTNAINSLEISTPDSTLQLASGRKARWHFQPTPKGENPPSRWEAGAYASPWLTSSSYLDGPDEYSVSTAPANGSPFVLSSGETIILTRERALDQHFRKQLTYHQLNLEGARQFSNGLRLGLGLLWENNNRSDLSLVKNLPGLLAEGNYAVLLDEKNSTLYTSLSAQYTFRRRMRLRYFAGVAATGQVYSHYSAEKFLYAQATGSMHSQEKIVNDNYHFLPVILFRPQVGFNYQLSSQLSLGLQVSSDIKNFEQVPDFGLGGRWVFR